ncbi:MAG: hypothetical protein IJS32_03745 [Kiritimatiellae bacterium]|nr:hypothetical protein [Kiritimatiellia bacterium]
MCGPSSIHRSMSVPDLRVNLNRPEPQPGPGGPQNPPQASRSLQALDPAVRNAVENPVPPNLQPGNGQGPQFAANHRVGAGRDWDMHSAEGMLETAQKAVAGIKAGIAAARAPDDPAVGELWQALADWKLAARNLRDARAALTAAVKDGSGAADPREGLAEIRKTLRVFRYEMQVELAKRGSAIGSMQLYEGALREIQHAFTFKVGSKVRETFAQVMRLEERFDETLSNLRNRLRELEPRVTPPILPPELKIANAAGPALELSHLTNDQIRDFQDAEDATATLRGIVGGIAAKGGSRRVEFSAGVGALFGLGFSKAFTAGVRAGARFRVVADIDAPGKGRPISVTFRIAGGLEAKGGVKAGKESAWAGAKAEGTAGGEVSHFTTRSYATVDDLILDAKHCKLATARTLGSAIWGGIKSLGRSVGGLGTKFFRWLGRKSGEVKQDNAQYLRSLQARGVAGRLDKLLAKRANPVIVAERKGWTLRGQAQATLGADFGGIVNAELSGGIAGEMDFKVDSRSYSSLARAAIAAKDEAALAELMLPDPDTGGRVPVTNYTGPDVARTLENEFEEALREAEEAEKRSAGPFSFTDDAGFARAGHKFRSLMLATELAARRGTVTREQADRLLARYSNPSVRFPPAIFRTCFMAGTGAAKPAKTRLTVQTKLKLGFFKDWSDGLSEGIANPSVKALADGGINTLRRETGLDTTVQYRFSSEKPAKPGADPRPWENVVRTKHELLVSGSAPARIVIDAITRAYAHGGQPLENRPEHPVKDAVKDIAKDIGKDTALVALTATLPGLILASVKEAAVAGVKRWLSDPENVLKLVVFALEHAGDALDFVFGVVEWVAEHPDLTLQIAASVMGTESLGSSERYKKISWTCVDGRFESVAVASESQNRIGVNVDPVGVGVGLGFDLSYSVTETVKDREVVPRPTLVMLLAKGEEFLFGETGLHPAGGGQAFKSWLSRNAMGVGHMLAHLLDERNMQETTEIYARAQESAARDPVLLQRLQGAWRAVHALPADATHARKVDAAHDLLVAMVLAFRTEGAEAA